MAEKNPIFKISPELLYTGREGYIFISYAHKDSERVLPIIDILSRQGYRVWFDQGLEIGTEWMNTIAEHIDGCKVFLYFLSKNSVASTYCIDEIRFGKEKHKHCILFDISDSSFKSDPLFAKINDLLENFDRIESAGIDAFLERFSQFRTVRQCNKSHDKTRKVLRITTIAVCLITFSVFFAVLFVKNGVTFPYLGDFGNETKDSGEQFPETEGLMYELVSDGEAPYYRIIGYNGLSNIVEVPVKKDGIPVSAISANAFFNSNEITDIIFHGNYDSFCLSAFDGCFSLKNITICGNVGTLETIDEEYSPRFACNITFEGEIGIVDKCSLVKNDWQGNVMPNERGIITLGKKIGELRCFMHCNYVYPDDIGVIVSDVLSFGSHELSGIPAGNFDDRLEKLNVTKEDGGYYYGNEKNKYQFYLGGDPQNIHSGTKYILRYSVHDYYDTIKIPEGVCGMIMAAGTNHDTQKLILPDTLRFIDSTDSQYIVNIELPASLETIGDDFWQHVHAGNISVDKKNQVFYSVDNCVVKRDGDILCYCKSTKLPDGISGVHKYALMNNPYLDTLVIPSGFSSFDAAILGNLKYTEIPSTVTSVDDTVFSHSFGEIVIDPQNTVYVMENNGTLWCPSTGKLIRSNNKGEVPDGVTEFYGSAFRNATELEHFELPDGLTEIPDGLFYGCKSLKEIKIPDSVKIIGENAFCGCQNLTRIDLPENLQEIESTAFSKSGLEKIDIPTSVTLIGFGAFLETNITEVNVPYTLNVCNSVFPEGITIIFDVTRDEFISQPRFSEWSLTEYENRYKVKFSGKKTES